MTARRLTQGELAAYHEHGYVIVEDFIPRHELDEMNAHLDELLTQQNREDHKPGNGWLMALGLASPRTEKFCEDPRILDLCESIVHPGIAIYSAKLVTKEAGDLTPCLWHQDEAYYSLNCDSKTRMSIWLPLQDTLRKEQGMLKIVPASHNLGLQPNSPKKHGTCNRSMDVPVDESTAIHVPVKAGSILLFSGMLWHASDGNTTDQRRRAFIVSYQEVTALCGNGKQWKILRPAESAA